MVVKATASSDIRHLTTKGWRCCVVAQQLNIVITSSSRGNISAEASCFAISKPGLQRVSLSSPSQHREQNTRNLRLVVAVLRRAILFFFSFLFECSERVILFRSFRPSVSHDGSRNREIVGYRGKMMMEDMSRGAWGIFEDSGKEVPGTPQFKDLR